LIEQKAASALRHLAHLIIFVVDPTENCGYSLEQQLNLLKEIKKQFKAPLIIALNKKDLATASETAQALKLLKKEQVLETGENSSIDELKQAIIQALKS
jgi:nucleolar GTP-binding protein